MYQHPKILGMNFIIAFTLYGMKKIGGIRGFGFYEEN
jgi:hypothetical protein